uniref:RRM domain-containing protein n=1 Tax=Kalanchoe fedtschenkoi TaxID=63787 RepID=A0A7N0V134_KALFE
MAKKRKLRPVGAQPAKVEEPPAEDTKQEKESGQQSLKEEQEAPEVVKRTAAAVNDDGEDEENPAKRVKEDMQEGKAEEEATDGDGDGDDEEEFEDEPLETLLEPFSKEQLLALVKEAVSRFPNFSESVLRVADADPAQRKIFVHGLGWDTTAETLISAFGNYGEIEDCKAVTDKITGKSKGYAFILFKHRSGAKKALIEPQKKIGARMASCQLASAGPVPSQAPAPIASVVAAAPPVSEYTQRKIFVSNVASDIDPVKLLTFFKQFGEIEEGPLGLDKQTSKPKGFALFVYKTVDGARKALAEPHKNFQGHILHCQKAIDGPKTNKFQNQQHLQQNQHHQSNYNHRKEKQHKYQPRGQVPPYGHLMAPSQGVGGFNPSVAAQAAMNPVLGQALTALIANQGTGIGLSNLLGGLGGPSTNHPGAPVMHSSGYVNPASLGFGTPQMMQGGYQNAQMGQGSSSRAPPGLHMGGPPYMGQ